MTWRGVGRQARRLANPRGSAPTSSSSGIIGRPFARIEGISARRIVRPAPPPEDILRRLGGKRTVGVDQALTKSSAER